MNKKIESIQEKLKESKFERERKKVRYEYHTYMLQSQRNNLKNLEEHNNEALKEFRGADDIVSDLQDQLTKIVNEEHEKKVETETN